MSRWRLQELGEYSLRIVEEASLILPELGGHPLCEKR